MKQYKYIYINFRVKFHLNEIVLIIHSFSLHSHSTLYSLRWLFMSSIKKTLSKLTGFFSRLNLKHSKMCQPTAIYRWEPVHSFKRSNSLIKRQWCKLQLRHCAVAHLFDETAAYYIISARRLLMFKQHGNNSVVFFFLLSQSILVVVVLMCLYSVIELLNRSTFSFCFFSESNNFYALFGSTVI